MVALRVVRGQPTDEELAALTVVLHALVLARTGCALGEVEPSARGGPPVVAEKDS
jgi:hypothetical protein